MKKGGWCAGSLGLKLQHLEEKIDGFMGFMDQWTSGWIIKPAQIENIDYREFLRDISSSGSKRPFQISALRVRAITASVPTAGKIAKTTAAMPEEGTCHDTAAALYSARTRSKTKPTNSFRITRLWSNHRIR